ncbi:hypothetical protein [Halobacillus mangrovi]|uniref:hypothetical protein n=1 Tax=Halobacillus mangrovi TaxID=402384 RepID=UPI003D9676AA
MTRFYRSDYYRKKRNENTQSTINFNPIIKVNCGCTHNKKDKECCECSGFGTATDQEFNFLADICPDCTRKGSVITFESIYGTSFEATSINPPICVNTSVSNRLLTVGTGTFVMEGTLYQGSYSLVLDDREGALNDLVEFLFVTFYDDGILIISDTFPPDDLSITPCPEASYSSSSHVFPAQFNRLNDLTENKFAKVTIIHSDGRVEERDLSKHSE